MTRPVDIARAIQANAARDEDLQELARWVLSAAEPRCSVCADVLVVEEPRRCEQCVGYGEDREVRRLTDRFPVTTSEGWTGSEWELTWARRDDPEDEHEVRAATLSECVSRAIEYEQRRSAR